MIQKESFQRRVDGGWSRFVCGFIFQTVVETNFVLYGLQRGNMHGICTVEHGHPHHSTHGTKKWEKRDNMKTMENET